MLYRTTCAILVKGDRIERGVEIELEPEVAANYGPDLEPVDASPEAEPEPEPEKPLEEMSKDELAAQAESLGLAKSGSKADLLERITLHLEGGELPETND